MKHLFFLLLSTLFSQFLLSQERYVDIITDSIEVATYTYASKQGEDLMLDIYLPGNDYEEKRAAVIYVHGGGFRGGTRKAGEVFCKDLAKLGYVTASISYRLTRKGKPEGFGCDCTAIDKLNTFNAAVEDLQDATFFLIQNRQEFGIDPQKIIISGSSAGAEAVLNAAYLPPYCYGLDSGPVSYAGVISMAGAIPDLNKIYDESAIPSLLFHGTCDKLVPYATAPHHYCNKEDSGYLILYGSFTIAQKLEQLGVPYWLHTTCGGGHELAGTPKVKYMDEIKEFCYEYVVKGGGETRRTVIPGDQGQCNYQQFNFCE
ncbi:hypothetical protein MNBD_BACTEROID01-956 [hydrothermal vent metagenome]|uniref:BD-FAE-like domain-containing protein n=1 Tax=hydrothermal vent metagenome TaxID=652676 RepID=A0A3B0TBW0_9ZZZZ